MAKITAKNKEFTGKRGLVAFIDGVAECDDPTMLAYFRRHGYKVEQSATEARKQAAAEKAAKEAAEKAEADRLEAEKKAAAAAASK